MHILDINAVLSMHPFLYVSVSLEVQGMIILLLLQSVFDKLDAEEKRKARIRSNPFETIRGGFFLNRAAMKMANMDKVFDFMFTKPKDEHNVSIPVFCKLLQEIITLQT
jgi:hypothetical protein